MQDLSCGHVALFGFLFRKNALVESDHPKWIECFLLAHCGIRQLEIHPSRKNQPGLHSSLGNNFPAPGGCGRMDDEKS